MGAGMGTVNTSPKARRWSARYRAAHLGDKHISIGAGGQSIEELSSLMKGDASDSMEGEAGGLMMSGRGLGIGGGVFDGTIRRRRMARKQKEKSIYPKAKQTNKQTNKKIKIKIKN